MDYEEFLAQDRRLIILEKLAETSDRKLNDRLLVRYLDARAHNVSYEVVRTDIRFLASLGAVVRTEVGGLVVAEITQTGEDHLSGAQRLEGVERPSARRA